VTDRAQVDAALAAIRAQLGPVKVLVNAAGLDGFKRFTDITFDEWQKVVDVNLNGVFHCIQAVLPDMVDAGWGEHLLVEHPFRHALHVALCGREVGGQWLDQVAGVGVRTRRHHGQRGAAGLHRHADAAQRRSSRQDPRRSGDHRCDAGPSHG
jgi:NAD(P)-dependent dehydrogenase (short-subunit alcohol dehydrogenase family)